MKQLEPVEKFLKSMGVSYGGIPEEVVDEEKSKWIATENKEGETDSKNVE